MFTHDESEAIALGAGMVARAADPALAKAARNALAKVVAVLPAGRGDEAGASGLVVGTNTAVATDRVDLAPIRNAIRLEQKIWIDYSDEADRRTERRIWPVSLTFCANVRLLAAWCELRQDYRHFRTDRISALAEIGERYPRPRRTLLRELREIQALPVPS
jgi:predicted DNA-binding transcriptional regulator YafY